MISRRRFMQASAGAAALLQPRRARAFNQSSGLGLTLFSQALRGSNVLSLATQIGIPSPAMRFVP